MKGYVLSVERFMRVRPAAVFDLLADPGKHPLFDGSGMLQEVKNGDSSHRLSLGAVFGMNMKLGVPYSTVNRVVEFEKNRRIAWRTGPEGLPARFVAGRVWRYELEPSSGGTLVRESWDLTSDRQRLFLKLGVVYRIKTERDMERTLARLEQLLTGVRVSER